MDARCPREATGQQKNVSPGKTNGVRRQLFGWMGGLLLMGSHGLHAQTPPEAPLQSTSTFTEAVFPLVHRSQASPVWWDAQDAPVVGIAAHALADDITRLTGQTPAFDSVGRGTTDARFPVIVGTLGSSALINRLVDHQKLNLTRIAGQWESYVLAVVQEPMAGVEKALVIAGSDPRGTAFGVFEVSRRLGVSPWYWWADVTPRPQTNLYLTPGTLTQGPPSVKYRGIFLNDEDWGLQPWAAQTYEPETGDIGPKTYARMFELLLRLKANFLWPAMHPSTRAFFHYPGNPQTAAAYAIVVGTSHAEPMLRNNVDEWEEATRGPFDYVRNPQAVHDYWEARVREASGQEAVYTVGMRGVHDSGMQGVHNASEAAALLETIIADQRAMLQTHVDSNLQQVPQAFTPYKEVLDIYDQGLSVPEDITLVWPDDNYGYIHRLSDPDERTRSGGSGVYYHASYWGRPHDYLWLSSTHPALIREEMTKAYTLGAERIWVLNVGDLKPLEYTISLFLDMAYEVRPFLEKTDMKGHLEAWATELFGTEQGPPVANALWDYYDLAFERRPEFMGWSRTEPTTATQLTAYNHFRYGDEAQRRLDRYDALVQRVTRLRAATPPDRKDAFYELVYYPVVCAALMNQKFLYRDKAHWYARQHRLSAHNYAQRSQRAYEAIVRETAYYNHELAGGKWRGMMSMEPRKLPVYQAPVLPELVPEHGGRWAVVPEGDSVQSATDLSLPTFTPWGQHAYFVDLFLTHKSTVAWKASASAAWLQLSERKGVLTSDSGRTETRLWVSVDWNSVRADTVTGTLLLKGKNKRVRVAVRACRPRLPAGYEGFVESNGYVSLFAEHFQRSSSTQTWQRLDGLGHTGASVQALPLTASAPAEVTEADWLAYDFYTFTAAAPDFHFYTLPTHPVTHDDSLRFGVSIDDGPVQVVNFQTFGRSETWKENVLRNSAVSNMKGPPLAPGPHTLKIYRIDPGVILDRMVIDLRKVPPAYSPVPETSLRAEGDASGLRK
ncbi:Glycosyl hydrolase family 115 [Catalinimonas alkaloidigena]|uniref:Glycosyl hydrolase family 115 n=2 Tax=Catalinimonas alkaloidigena TaxID=1075417 RepID=A0A1G9SW45_9BACT|nr:Glycosyl hydrolase family 115 [Catalinimonas alkaloidigena]